MDGEYYELDEPPTLDKKFRHDIDVVVDRLVVREGMETRLADSFRTALTLRMASQFWKPFRAKATQSGSHFRKISPVLSAVSRSPKLNRDCFHLTPPLAHALIVTG